MLLQSYEQALVEEVFDAELLEQVKAVDKAQRSAHIRQIQSNIALLREVLAAGLSESESAQASKWSTIETDLNAVCVSIYFPYPKLNHAATDPGWRYHHHREGPGRLSALPESVCAIAGQLSLLLYGAACFRYCIDALAHGYSPCSQRIRRYAGSCETGPEACSSPCKCYSCVTQCMMQSRHYLSILYIQQSSIARTPQQPAPITHRGAKRCVYLAALLPTVSFACPCRTSRAGRCTAMTRDLLQGPLRASAQEEDLVPQPNLASRK